jgi:hypothetical protein
MEKSSEVVLSKEEKDQILGKGSLTKTAGEKKDPVPERFKGWYTESELKEIASK